MICEHTDATALQMRCQALEEELRGKRTLITALRMQRDDLERLVLAAKHYLDCRANVTNTPHLDRKMMDLLNRELREVFGEGYDPQVQRILGRETETIP